MNKNNIKSIYLQGDDMQIAEHYAMPVRGHWALFQMITMINLMSAGEKSNLICFFAFRPMSKSLLKVYRERRICETYIVDTDAFDCTMGSPQTQHSRVYITDDFGPNHCVKFAFIIHKDEHSIVRKMSTYSWIVIKLRMAIRNIEGSPAMVNT